MVRDAADGRDDAAVDDILARLSTRASSASALNAVARELAGRGRLDEAWTFAGRAILADMSCALCYDTLALVLHARGDDGEASWAQAIAVNLTPDGYDTDAMRDRWHDYNSAAPWRSRPTSSPYLANRDSLDRAR